MRYSLRWSVLGLVLGGGISSADAGISASYQVISSAAGANDMSPDGRWIVGPSTFGPAYRYDTVTTQMLMLPNTGFNAIAVSDNGQTIVGEMGEEGVREAAIWTASTNSWQSIGFLPGASEGCGTNISSGYELSADGSVVVGLSWVNGCQARAFRWTQATGMIEMPMLGQGGNRASACSGSGNLIGGFARGPVTDRSPAIWTWNGSSATGQLLDPTGTAMGEIYGINDTATVLLGNWNGKACHWTYPGLVRTQIGAGSNLPGWTGVPQGIANDGTTVGFDILFGNRRAWIQLAGTGPIVDFKSYIESNGAFVPPGTILEVCQAISTDGRTIIGHGNGTGSWIVKLIPISTCTGDIAPSGGDAIVNVQDLLAVIAAWGEIGEELPADINDDFMVNVQDLLAVIGAWGA